MENQSPDTLRRAPTIHDVAAALGMHKSTVSLGLSGRGNVAPKTRERIEAVAREMGYQPNPLAQRLAMGADNKMVCLCAGDLDVGITTEKILRIQKQMAGRGWETPIYTLPLAPGGTPLSQAAQIGQLCRQQPRAIVCSALSLHASVYPELARYQEQGGIIVAYDVAVPLACDQVVFDREDNAYQAARYLIERGHRQLGLALSKWHEPGGDLNRAQNARAQGFERALHEAGLSARAEWIWEEPLYERGGVELARHFLEMRERPTGLCIVNDYMALAFMAEVLRAGVQIPRDLSVMGHDNQTVAAYCPVPLTCATQPQDEIIEAVVERLCARLNGEAKPPQTVTVRGTIVARESVAAV